jgi:hypothetical protein
MAAPISPETNPPNGGPTFQEVEAMLHELMRFDKRCIRNIPIAALQMAVDALLQRGMAVDRTKMMIDMFCNKVSDGRLDYTDLFESYRAAVLREQQDQELEENEGIREADSDPGGPAQEDAGVAVQRYFKQWAMGRLDAQVFINKLNQLEAIQQIGGVSPGCRRKIEEHQFDHDLQYSDFLRALRNTGKPPPMVDYLDREKTQMKRIFETTGGKRTQDILFPPEPEGEELMGTLSVVSNRPVQNMHADKKFSSSGVAQALTASEYLPPAQIDWTPSSGVELVSTADAGAAYIGAEGDGKEFNHKFKKNFPVRDDVAGLLTQADDKAVEENVCGSRRRRLPERQSKPGALFGGGASVMDSLAGYDDKPSDRLDLGSAAGAHVVGERPVGKKTYGNLSAFGREGDNSHIAVGDRVNDFGQMTTQELLWGNMIRRAR